MMQKMVNYFSQEKSYPRGILILLILVLIICATWLGAEYRGYQIAKLMESEDVVFCPRVWAEAEFNKTQITNQFVFNREKLQAPTIS